MPDAGAPVRKLGKRRAWVVISAGSLLVVFGIGLIVLMAYLRATATMSIPAATEDAFIARLDIGFGMIAVSGIVAVVNGTYVLRTGRPSAPLTIAVIVIFAVAAYTISTATKMLPNS